MATYYSVHISICHYLLKIENDPVVLTFSYYYYYYYYYNEEEEEEDDDGGTQCILNNI